MGKWLLSVCYLPNKTGKNRRHGETVDLCYGSIKGSYKSMAQAPLGMSDHNTAYLSPTYKSVPKRGQTCIDWFQSGKSTILC